MWVLHNHNSCGQGVIPNYTAFTDGAAQDQSAQELSTKSSNVFYPLRNIESVMN